MKKTLPGSSAVRKEATSALRSSAGPAVCTIGTPSSAATMWASEVLPRPGRAGEQDVVERLAAPARRLDEDRQLLGHLLLVDEVGQGRRPQRAVEVLVGSVGAGVVDPDLGVDRDRLVVDPRGADAVAADVGGLAHAALLDAAALRSAAATSSSGRRPRCRRAAARPPAARSRG